MGELEGGVVMVATGEEDMGAATVSVFILIGCARVVSERGVMCVMVSDKEVLVSIWRVQTH